MLNNVKFRETNNREGEDSGFLKFQQEFILNFAFASLQINAELLKARLEFHHGWSSVKINFLEWSGECS